MITAVIVDDEQNAIEMLEWLLKTYCPNVRVLEVCDNGEKGIEAVRLHQPDLLFLDIDMPGMSGFEMLGKLGQTRVQVVFTTAYDQYAVQAFRHAALNYLLKPIDPDELTATIARFENSRQIIDPGQIKLLLEQLNPQKKTTGRIALSSGDGLVFVNTSDIAYCKADSNYTTVVMADGRKITVARTLKDLDDTLGGGDFVRVHNSYLVNISHIQKYVRGDGGYIIMPDGSNITISRSKRDEFFQLFSRF